MTNSTLPKTFSNHPFWKFSLKIYSLPQVENALLLLQNNHGFNINIFLYCCWYAFRGQGRLHKNEIKELVQSVQYWHEKITLPLRKCRLNLKKSLDKAAIKTIYQELLHQELFSEQVEQLLLADVLAYQTKPIRTSLQKIIDTCKNIVMYAQVIKVNLHESDEKEITEVLSAIFDKIDRNDIVKCCKNVLIGGDGHSLVMASQLQFDL